MNAYGYALLAISMAITVHATIIAIGTRRTRDAEIAWHLEQAHTTLLAIVHLADTLATQGHPDPGTAALAAYRDAD